MEIEKAWEAFKYFKPEEFDSPDEPGSGLKMNISFIEVLDKIRKECNFSFHINSGFRTIAHNAEVAVVEKSAHTLGIAADISVSTSDELFKIVQSALANGITRIGIARTFVHLDMDLSKPQHVIWLYPGQ